MNLPNKKDTLHKQWSDIRRGNILSFIVNYSQHNLWISAVPWWLKETQSAKELQERPSKACCAVKGLSPRQSLGSSKVGPCRALYVYSNSASAGTLYHTACESWCQSKCILAKSAGSLFSLLQPRCLKNIPGFVSLNVGNKVGNLGEHHMGSNDRLNVIFITAPLVWLEKVVTVQQEFSFLSLCSVTEDINPKTKPPFLPFPQIIHTSFILLTWCSLQAFSFLACFRWF